VNGKENSCGNNKLMINYCNFFILPNSSIVVYEINFSFPKYLEASDKLGKYFVSFVSRSTTSTDFLEILPEPGFHFTPFSGSRA